MAGDGARVTAAQVGRKLGVSPQAASEMFRRLVADGLVTQADGRELSLTQAGRAAADGIFRRHALCEWLLTEIVGLGWAESDVEAERLQAAISPRVEARLDELLGHPETCPHGNPIDVEATRRRPEGIRLSETAAGDRATIYRITEEAEEDPALLSYLEARGLRPGVHVSVLARSESLDSLTLDGPLGRATLGLRPAALVRVLPGDADPALFHHVPQGEDPRAR
jgi:DtxR family Mn-dependent transcriptional regulator